ncbi:MAG: TolC family protein [Planctomycetia bacterium]|nr:TolC family protein [Planctomycetia bacterium]
MSAVGDSESAPSIVRPDPALLDPATRSAALPNRSLFERSDGSGTDRKSSGKAARGGAARALRTFVMLLIATVLLVGTGWAALKYAPFASSKTGPVVLTHTVQRSDLVVTITDDGNVESASNIDIRCLVAGGGVIKDIITDGTIVKQGDRLVEIDSAAIDEAILQQKIGYEKARAVRDQAKNDLEAAKITLREYVEGTYLKERQAVDSQITIAEENMRSAQNTLLYTERMFRKGYVTPLQLESQQFAVKRSGLDLDTAKTAKRVLEEFTFAKMKNDLETQVSTAGAKATSEEAAFALEESKLKRLETQKLNCIIVAPQSGMVVYANETGGGRNSSDRPKIEEGAQVRENQVILRVPDLTQMQVKATVHESKVESLRPNMRASIGIQNRKLTGHVTTVANQPEPGSWMASNIKEYAAYVRIDGAQNDLKPGMTAEVVILVAEKKNVLTVPVQCIVEQAGKFYCWKSLGATSEKTEVKLGPGDDRKVEVVSGLSEGDVVLQNPPEKSGGEFSSAGGTRQFGDGPRGTGASGRDAKGPGSDSPGASGGPSTGAGPAGTRGAGGGRGVDIMSMDKNGDGKVSLDEAPEQMKNFFGRIDTDGDGFITAAESAAAKARRAANGGGAPGAGPPAGPGGNQ